MFEIVNLENVDFCSVENKMGYNKKTGRHFITKEYQYFKKLIWAYAKKSRIKLPSPYRVIIKMSTSLDMDNTLKGIYDGLEQAGVIDNDKNILECFIFKVFSPRGKPGKLKIYIDTIIQKELSHEDNRKMVSRK